MKSDNKRKLMLMSLPVAAAIFLNATKASATETVHALLNPPNSANSSNGPLLTNTAQALLQKLNDMR